MRRVLRGILWALAIAFLVGLLIGSLLRREIERPVRYIGARSGAATTAGDRRIASERSLVRLSHESSSHGEGLDLRCNLPLPRFAA